MQNSTAQKEEILRRLAAQFLEMNSNRTSLISVTRLTLSPDGAHATIYVSVLPDTEEETALHFLKRQRKELKEFIKKNSKMGRIPFLDIEIDLGEKNRQRIDEISIKDRLE